MGLHVVGIGGATNGGKSTLCEKLASLLNGSVIAKVVNINQDAYFKHTDDIMPLPEINYFHFDIPQSVDFAALLKDFKQIKLQLEESGVEDGIVLIEGNMIYLCPELENVLTMKWFIDITFHACKQRRESRNYVPPDEPGYFDRYAWPAYEVHRNEIKATALSRNIRVLDGTVSADHNYSLVLAAVLKALSPTQAYLSPHPLSLEVVQEFLANPDCGGTSIFIGTTRRDQSPGDASVTHLEYSAYKSMARKELLKLTADVKERWPDVVHFVAVHRIGLVKVGEPGVIVGASSPHRVACQEAVAWAIDELKLTVPIWKKEYFDDGKTEWKENERSVVTRPKVGGIS